LQSGLTQRLNAVKINYPNDIHDIRVCPCL